MEKQNFYEKTEKKFIEFLREYNEPSRAKMFEELYKLTGVEFEYLWKYPQDYQNPASGSISGLIYYNDTEPFAKDFFHEIDEILTEYGFTKRIPLNDMTWAAWEELQYQFTTFKEEHEEQHPENEDEEDQTQENQ